MTAAVQITVVLLMLILHSSRAQKPPDASTPQSDYSDVGLSGEYFMSLVMLGLTVVLSGIIYLWVLRYICIGCCQPVSVGAEPEALDGMV